jgi:tetratricopeptide (TPR) repeat protein
MSSAIIVRRSHLLVFCFYLLIFFPPQQATSQQTASFGYLDSVAFSCYTTADWKCVLEASEQSLRMGYDYHFLRMRMGIALFSLQRYRQAAMHFEKALQFNFFDQYARDYLQKCYAWGGQELALAAFEKRIHMTQPFVRQVYFGGGISFSGSKAVVDDLDLDGGYQIYGEINSPAGYGYGSIGLVLTPLQGVRWPVQYTHLQLNKEQRFVLDGIDTVQNQYKLLQRQLSVGLPVKLASHLYLHPEFDIFFINSSPQLATYDTLSGIYNFNARKSRLNHYVVSLKLVKERTGINYGLALSQSNLGGQNQLQASFILAYYPFKNLDFYTYSRFSMLIENSDNRFNFKQLAGMKLSNYLWLQGGVHAGQLKNAPDESTSLMYHVDGRILYNLSATVFVLLTEQIKLQLDCFFIRQEGNYYVYYDYSAYSTQYYRYNNIHLKGGLVWKL